MLNSIGLFLFCHKFQIVILRFVRRMNDIDSQIAKSGDNESGRQRLNRRVKYSINYVLILAFMSDTRYIYIYIYIYMRE